MHVRYTCDTRAMLVTMNDETAPDFIGSLERDLDRIRSLCGDLSASIPSCPGWDLARLIGHLGRVHRMALAVLTTGAMQPADPSSLDAPPTNPLELQSYFASSSARLVDTLRSVDPNFACWTFLNGPHVASFWLRRQAQEHAIHRVDAELAVGDPRPISTPIACDGIDEYLLMQTVRVLPKRPAWTLGGSLHLHATDAASASAGEWMIQQRDATLVCTHEHGKGDAAIRGTASDLLLGLWGRLDLTSDARFERFGNPAVIAAAASLGGT